MFSDFPVLLPRCSYLALGCNLWLPPDALLCGNILSFDCVGSSSFLDDCRPFSGRIPGNSLVHTGLCYSIPCVVRRAHSRHIVGRYIYLSARVGRGRPSRIALLPGPDHCAVLCAKPVMLAGCVGCTCIGPVYVHMSGISCIVFSLCNRLWSGSSLGMLCIARPVET